MIFADNQRIRCVSIVLGIGRLLTAHDLLQVVNQNGRLLDGSGSLTIGCCGSISECAVHPQGYWCRTQYIRNETHGFAL